MGRSQALESWLTWRAELLGQFVELHAAVEGGESDRRKLTEQLSRAYLLAVGAQFQGFCRDLHSEAAAAIVGATPSGTQTIVARNLSFARFLDKGNPRAGALGSDFGRLGPTLWRDLGDLVGVDEGKRCNAELERLMIWRNSIAHEAEISDDDRAKIAGTEADLPHVARWRSNLDELASRFDEIVGSSVQQTTGTAPW